jgi:hypothetical protein
MTEKSSERSAGTLAGALQHLLVSGLRVSVAVNLYTLQQIQKTIEATRGHGVPAATLGVAGALDSLSDSLENSIDDIKKEALQSVRRVATKAAERSFAIFSPAAGGDASSHSLRTAEADPAASAQVEPLIPQSSPPTY